MNNLPVFTQTVDVAYKNDTTTTNNLKFRFKKWEYLKANLNRKRMRVQKFTVNNTSVPVFIPDRLKTNTLYYYITAGGTGILPPENNTLTPNSLEYFTIVREISGTNSIASKQFFINHIPENPNLPAPSFVIDDDVSYYLNEYYYYYDFLHFLAILEDALNNSISALEGVTDNYCSFVLEDTGITLYVEKTMANKYTIEISDSLKRIIPFKSYLSNFTVNGISHVLDFPIFETASGATTYKSISCQLYETVFPFSELLIRSEDIGANYTIFVNNEDVKSNQQQGSFESIILSYNIRTNLFNQIYDFYQYVNNNDSLWVNFKENKSDDNYFTIELFLRLKNNVVIPYKLKPNDLFTLTFDCEYYA